MKSQRRILELDGLRTIAVSLVIAAHYFSPLTFQFKQSIQWFLKMGWSGVDLFFVLSGYLVCSILFEQRRSPVLYRTFYIRRILRIVPLYYVSLLLGMLAVYWFPDRQKTQAPWWVFFVHGQYFWFIAAHSWTYSFLNVTWSLAVEEYFYLTVPWLVRRLSLSRLRAGCISAAVAFPLVRLTLWKWDPSYHLVSTILRPDGLFMGAWLAFTLHDPGRQRAVFPYLRVWSRVWGVLGAGVVFVHANPWGWKFSHDFLVGILYSWVCLFYLLSIYLLLSPLALGRTRAFLTLPSMVLLGQSSYGAYLLHMWVYTVLTHGVDNFSVWTALLAWLATIMLAAASWQAWEKHLVALGHRFSYAPAMPLTLAPTG